MFVSMKWLGRHVDLAGISPEDLARELTMRTAEVEGWEPFAPHLSAITVGEVVEQEAHSGADRLSVCSVDVGGDAPLTIVCGAPNVRAGLKVAVATVGTLLPGDFKIKKAKIRGVASSGMICSFKELELGEDHDSIWELPQDAPVGRPLAEALDLADWVLEIDNKSLSHRPDLWGHRGLAREVAAIFGRELLPLDTSLPETGGGRAPAVTIEANACPRYLALAIDGVRVEPSPLWLRCLLAAAGQRPLDLLVDLSNFVMLDLGQPNHLFDRARVAEGILVRMATAGEEMVTLDGQKHRLGEDDLLICSGGRPVALAGVMGGEDSKVGAETTELLLEVANFHGTTVRRTATRTGLRSESSARFEKSLDPNQVPAAAGHLFRTLRSIQPDVTLPAPASDAGDWTDPATIVALDPQQVRERLGVDLADEAIGDFLGSLGFGVPGGQGGGDSTWDVSIPSWRATKDISIPEDLIEEVGRLYGYDRIPPRRLEGEITPPAHDDRRTLIESIQDRLAGGARFHEVLGYSFLQEELCQRLGIAQEPHVRLVNPVAEGEDRVRRSVIPSLLERLELNRRQREDVAIFEVGKGYLPENPGDRNQPQEIHETGLVLAAPHPGKKARFDAGAWSTLAGVLEDLLQHLGHGTCRFVRPADDQPLPAWAHPGRSAACVLADGTVVGLLSELEPGLHRPLGLVEEMTSDVACATLSLDALLAAKKATTGLRPIPRFPETKVDVALAVPASLPATDVAALIEKAGKGLVAELELFDLYRGGSLEKGMKSLAWHLRLGSADRTLDEGDVSRFLRRLERAAEAIGACLRRD
jgi:phenylalanyl-tRNA synthetase beta chain